MKSAIIAAFATLLAAGQAAPATSSNSGMKVARDYENFCGASSFVGATSGASPLVSDCQQITTNIADGGTWDINPFEQRELVSHGSCAFGIEPGGSVNIVMSIGNGDIIELINDSIAQFESDGKIGAEGTMECDEGTVTWGIY